MTVNSRIRISFICFWLFHLSTTAQASFLCGKIPGYIKNEALCAERSADPLKRLEINYRYFEKGNDKNDEDQDAVVDASLFPSIPGFNQIFPKKAMQATLTVFF